MRGHMRLVGALLFDISACAISILIIRRSDPKDPAWLAGLILMIAAMIVTAWALNMWTGDAWLVPKRLSLKLGLFFLILTIGIAVGLAVSGLQGEGPWVGVLAVPGALAILCLLAAGSQVQPRSSEGDSAGERGQLLVEVIVCQQAITALEAGRVDRFLVDGRMYSRDQLDELYRLRMELRARVRRL